MLDINKKIQDFQDVPVLGWAIDDWQAFYNSLMTDTGSRSAYPFSNREEINTYINRYFEQSFRDNVSPIFTDASLPLNLGGKTEKERLMQTSIPQGVFDFSLASQGLYRVPEYYSEKLAQDFPNKFAGYGTVAGIVPPNFVKKDISGFYFEDKDGRFPCKIRQKGQTEIDLGVKGSKLKYATRNKKVYLTFKRNRGKVKYVEFYSLFYYTSLTGDAQFAIRHIPAMMAAEYLESIGIKVRFYMTRFVALQSFTLNGTSIRQYWKENKKVKLPLYEESPQKKDTDFLLVQPIIAKDYGEEIDKPLFFCISSASFSRLYNQFANYTFEQELTAKLPTGGNPDWKQVEYRNGFDRYVNKYQLYNKLGIFKAKEVLPEAMIFFHDMVIKDKLDYFINNVSNRLIEARSGNTDFKTKTVATNNVTSPFFNWWMRVSATNLKNKVILINSNELVKDIKQIESEINQLYFEYKEIIKNIPAPTVINGANQYTATNTTPSSLRDFLELFGREILQRTIEIGTNYPTYGYNVLNSNNEVDIKLYINSISDEISTYTEGVYFPTEIDTVEKRDSLLEQIGEALLKI